MNMQDYIHAADRIEIDDRCREEILNMTADTTLKTQKARKPAIRIAAGFAVAAAILALNGALIFAIYSARNGAEFPEPASESAFESVPEDEDDFSEFEGELHPIENTGSELPDLSVLGWDRNDFCRMEEPFDVSAKGVFDMFEWYYTEELPVAYYTQYRDENRNVIVMDDENRIYAIYTNYNALAVQSGTIKPDQVGDHLSEEELEAKADSIMRALMPDYDMFEYLSSDDQTDVAGYKSNPYYYFRHHELSDSFQYRELAGITLKADGTIHQFAVKRHNRDAVIDLAAYDKAAADMLDWLETENAEIHLLRMETSCGHPIALYAVINTADGEKMQTVLVSPEFTLPERNPDYPYRIKENMLSGMAKKERSKEYSVGKLEITAAQVFDDEISVQYSFTPSEYIDKKIKKKDSEHLTASCMVMGKIFDENGEILGILAPLEKCYGHEKDYSTEPMQFRNELKAVLFHDYKYEGSCWYDVTTGEAEYTKLEIPENAYIWLYLYSFDVTGTTEDSITPYCDFSDYIDTGNSLATKYASCCKIVRGTVGSGETDTASGEEN